MYCDKLLKKKVQLYYREFGEEGLQPLVILHGLFGMSDNWVSFAKNVSEEGFHVFVPDQRNHGRSGHSGIHNYVAMVDDLLEFLDSLALDQVFLLGHSMGGKTAMQFSIDYPERVRKLVVVDISPASGTHGETHRGIIDALLSADFGQYNGRQEAATALKGLIPSQRLRQFLQKNLYWKDRGSLGWRINLEAVRENLHEIFKSIDTPIPFDKPVLFIRGGHSDYIPDRDFPLIVSLFPQARIKTIPGAGHWLHAEQPDEFLRELLFFLMETP